MLRIETLNHLGPAAAKDQNGRVRRDQRSRWWEVEGRSRSARRSHIIPRPPGLHVGGLWVENRRPGEEPTQDAGEDVNFTQEGSRLRREPRTRSAERLYLLCLVKAIGFHCARHSSLGGCCL